MTKPLRSAVSIWHKTFAPQNDSFTTTLKGQLMPLVTTYVCTSLNAAATTLPELLTPKVAKCIFRIWVWDQKSVHHIIGQCLSNESFPTSPTSRNTNLSLKGDDRQKFLKSVHEAFWIQKDHNRMWCSLMKDFCNLCRANSLTLITEMLLPYQRKPQRKQRRQPTYTVVIE